MTEVLKPQPLPLQHPLSTSEEAIKRHLEQEEMVLVISRPCLNITDLPPELLENIFTYLHPDLEGLLRLSSVCVKFRNVGLGVPITVHIPLQEKQLQLLSCKRIPILTLCNQEPALFVKYQIFRLNLCRLFSAQLVANDYLPRSNMSELSPHYIEVLEHLTSVSSVSLKQLMVNVDLQRTVPVSLQDRVYSQDPNANLTGLPRCADLISKFRNLNLLSLHFTPQIELKQRILGTDSMQQMLDKILSELIHLKTLYIFVCPTQKLSLKSNSLEKLCIYKSEFVDLRQLNMPKLKVMMLHEGLIELFFKANQDQMQTGQNVGRKAIYRLFDTLYDGCPQLDFFNTVDLSILREHQVTKKQWSYYALKMCIRQYKKKFGPHLTTAGPTQNSP